MATFQNEYGGYEVAPGYSTPGMAGLAGFAANPIVGLATTAVKIGTDIFDYYANKRREREAAEKEERRYQDYLVENKRRYDEDSARQNEVMKTNKMLTMAQLNANMQNRKDAIEGQNYSRYKDLQAGLDKMINTSSYRNKFQSTWGS